MTFYSNTLADIRRKLQGTGYKTDYPEIDDIIKTDRDYYQENPQDFIRRTQKTIITDGTGERYIKFISDSDIQKQVDAAKIKTSYLEFIVKALWQTILELLNGQVSFNVKMVAVLLLFFYILRGFFA